MTPTLLALSRAYLALPGAPKQEHAGVVVATGLPLLGRRYRTPDGYLWKWDDETTQWLLDLTDEATGGVLVERFPELLTVRTVRDADGNRMYFGSWRRATDRDECTLSPSPYLGEFVARAAVALGRAS